MNWRQLLILPPLAVAIGIFYWLTSQQESDPKVHPEIPVAVRTQTIELSPFKPQASGFGRLQAELTWQAIAQVAGRATQIHPKLAVGAVVGKGELIAEIDRRDYEIAVAKVEANLQSAEAQLNELAAKESNTRASLELEKRIEQSQQTDFERKKKLVDSGTNSPATLDQALRTLLGQQQRVLELQNNLSLYPAQRVTVNATIATRKAELEEAQRNLDNTRIYAPFTGRVTQEQLAAGQYVRTGDTLATIDEKGAAEVIGEFQPRVIGELVRFMLNGELPNIISGEDREESVNLLRQLGLKAEIHSEFGASGDRQTIVWPAEISRVSGRIDDSTGTAGIVVSVDNTAAPDIENQRPPLPTGAFVEVILSAPEPIPALVIPRSAIHRHPDGRQFVYLADGDSRLERRFVTLGPSIQDVTMIVDGLSVGETLLLSRPQPAIIGMLLEAVPETANGTGQ